jgi:hypothetical protein
MSLSRSRSRSRRFVYTSEHHEEVNLAR